MRYDGEDCPICHRIGTSEPIIKHREYSNPTNNRRGKNAGKFIGILVVIVLGLVLIPVGMMYLGSDNPETPKGRDIELGDDGLIIDGKKVESQIPSLIPKEFTILDDGILTYKMDPIPYYTSKETDFIKEAVYDGFNAWSQLNPKLVFSEISVGDPDIRISWIDFRGTHVGTGCLNCLHDGATIEVVLEQRDCNGKLVQYDKDMITFTVAHEFGHNLGLEHNADENHLMWSTDHPQISYDALGYNIPKLPSGNIVGYKELNDKYNLLGEYLNVSGKELDLLETEYSQIPEEVSSDEEYQRAVQMYDKINTKVDDFNNMIELQNQYVEMMNCLLGDNITYKDNHGVLTIIIPKKEI